VRVVLELAPDLPALRVDRDQVRLVLDALVANAADAMPDGGTLTVRTAAANRAAVLSVADTGAGIAPEHLGRLFEPLFTTKPRAAGLGLTVARALAEANGARLAVASLPGGGSRFDVVFPAPDETEGRWRS
jgi:signal transduction histidine kinase